MSLAKVHIRREQSPAWVTERATARQAAVLARLWTRNILITAVLSFSSRAALAQQDSVKAKPLVAGTVRTTIAANARTAGAVVPNLTELLGGQSPGLTVYRPNGLIGTGGVLRARGVRSLALSGDPILEVDGIIVPVSTGRLSIPSFGNFNGARLGGEALIDLIDPDDIESIEVVPGLAGAIEAGPGAVNGLVRIRTKHGQAGRTAWRWSSEIGASRDPADYGTVYWGLDPQLPSSPCTLAKQAGGACTVSQVYSTKPANDPATSLFGTGYRQKLGLDVSGGGSRIRYWVGGRFSNETGVFELPERQLAFLRTKLGTDNLPSDRTTPNRMALGSLRANLEAKVARNLSIGLHLNLARATPRSPFNQEIGGFLTGREFFFLPMVEADPVPGHDTTRLAIRGSADAFDQAIDRRLNRQTFGIDARWDPRGDLRAWFTAAVLNTSTSDLGSTRDTAFNRVDLGGGRDTVFVFPISKLDTTSFRDRSWQIDAGGTWAAASGRDFDLRLTGLVQFRSRSVLAKASTFSDIGSGSAGRSAASDQAQSTVGGVVSASARFGPRWTLTGLARRDLPRLAHRRDNGLTSFAIGTSYQVSAPGSPVGMILTANAASAARRPSLDDDLTSSAFVGFPLGTAPFVPTPERTRSVEFGVSVAAPHDRARVAVAFFRDRIDHGWGQIGFVGTFQPVVIPLAIRLRSDGLEATGEALLVSNRSIQWDASLTLAVRKGRVDSLDGPVVRTGLTCNQVGSAPYSLCGTTRDPAIDANGDGIIVAGELGPERPFRAGRQTLPTRMASLRSQLVLPGPGGQWRTAIQVDYAGGAQSVDQWEAFRCLNSQCRANVDPGTPLQEQAGALGFQFLSHAFDARYLRLRELSVGFQPRWRPLGTSALTFWVSGRNLATATSFPGPDPEVRVVGGSVPTDALQPAIRRSVTFRIAAEW